MHVVWNESLEEQAKRYRLAFTCEKCGYWAASSRECSILYPTTDHLDGTIASLEYGDRVYFCKMFEAL